MKKIFTFLFVFILSLALFSGCKTDSGLFPYVSELRSDVFEGKSQTYHIKGAYGYKEDPFINDKKVGKLVSNLHFRMINPTVDGAIYTITIELNEQTLSSDFKLNPITHSLGVSVQLEDFSLKEFTIKISCSGAVEEVIMTSILPQNTISASTALKVFEKEQPSLIKNLTTTDGVFDAEIYLRVLVKDQKPYWYVGIARGNSELKALLIDGLTCEILAVRDII